MAGTPVRLTPELLLRAYAMGIFPMADSRDSPDLHWMDPSMRGVFPIEGFHISRSLARRIRRADYRATVDTAFPQVMRACADRPETWINAEIFDLCCTLHERGFAHSQEIWQGERLIGGVYGIALGTAFFGESMFSRAVDGSKLALAHLIARLRAGGFTLFDTQYLTPHLASLGAVEIPRASYRRQLEKALQSSARFDIDAPPI